jgi:hypothetical protein
LATATASRNVPEPLSARLFTTTARELSVPPSTDTSANKEVMDEQVFILLDSLNFLITELPKISSPDTAGEDQSWRRQGVAALLSQTLAATG